MYENIQLTRRRAAIVVAMALAMTAPALGQSKGGAWHGYGRGVYQQPWHMEGVGPQRTDEMYPPAPTLAQPEDRDQATPDDAAVPLDGPSAPDAAPSTPDTPAFDDAGADDFADPSGFAGGATANVGGGLNTPMLGRADFNNRMNIFDGMTAVPANRIWFAFQTVNDFNTGVEPSGGILNPVSEELVSTPDEVLYRFGAEIMFTGDFSIAVQGQYHTVDADFIPDDLDNPLFMAKRVVYRDCCQTTSLVMGLQAEIGHDEFSLADTHTRIYPGILSYHTLSDRWFGQWAIQYGIPLEDGEVYTLDWAASLGYWAHRNCDPCGCSSLYGIVTQAELLGRSAIGSESFSGPRDPMNGLDLNNVFFSEPDDVIDATLGVQFMYRSGWRLGVAWSFALTGEVVRDTEFIGTASYTF